MNYEEQYKDFMYNPDNVCNCEECPENMDPGTGYSRSEFDRRLPCGQTICWVTTHCDRCNEEEDGEDD